MTKRRGQPRSHGSALAKAAHKARLAEISGLREGYEDDHLADRQGCEHDRDDRHP
jgi:hypothetical protein